MSGARIARTALLAAFVMVSPSLMVTLCHAEPVEATPTYAAPANKKPLDYRAYDSWSAIRGSVVSDDGKYLAYVLTPEDGDPTLVVRDLTTGTERREARGSAPQFADNGRYVIFTRLPPKVDSDRATRDKVAPALQPKSDLGILDLQGDAKATIVERVRSAVVAKRGGAVIAYRAEPAPSPSASPSAAASAGAHPTSPATGEPHPAIAGNLAPSAAPSTSPSATASASPTPAPAPTFDKTKETESTMTVRDLARGTQFDVANVTEFAISDNDSVLAYATQTKAGGHDGVHVYDVASGGTHDVLTGNGRYRKLALARDGAHLAFLSDTATFAGVPRDALYIADTHADGKPVTAVDTGTAGLPAAMTPNANGSVTFSRDGARVFLGTAAAPTPLPAAATPKPMAVDIWTWHDDKLQSAQRHDADTELKRTYTGMYDIAAARYVQLGDVALRDVTYNENADVALGYDTRAYARSASWLGEEYADLYAVSLTSGARRRIETRASSGYLSPDGGYVLSWDESSRHWYATATATGRRVELAAHAGVPFYDVDDDHPAPKSPYGTGGWLAGDRGVMIYDEYDVWLADPRTGNAVNITHGAGRRAKTVYSPLQTDREALAFAPDKPLLLGFIDTNTYASGFARVPASGGTPQTLLRRDALVSELSTDIYDPLHNRVQAPLASRDGSRLLFTETTFREYPNLYASDASFAHPTRVTDAAPQQANYRWGSEHLISYRAADGTPLRAIVLLPDGAQRDHRLPQLLYFYERWSDAFHSYYRPGPGTSPNIMRYVSNGYAVVLFDVHYKAGHPGDSAVKCILAALDASLKEGYADPARVGIAGHSWAAYQINYLITKTHRFRAVEAGAAVDDMFSAYAGIRLESGNVREGQYEHGQSRIGATPWDRPDLFMANSGLFGIKNITTPYLTIHNDGDDAVPQAQGIEFITDMRRLHKEAYLFSFDGEFHNLHGREQQKYWTVHLDEWFDYWLKGAARPGWFEGVDFLHRGERDVRTLYGEPPL
jgi:dipeptidyl aminopeptidase/acylaminoacyl peptidase